MRRKILITEEYILHDRELNPSDHLKRVLLVARVQYKGGAETITLTLANGLEKFGWKPYLAAPSGGDLQDAADAQGTTFVPCSFDRMRITSDIRLLSTYPFAWKRGSDAILNACKIHEINLIHVHHPVTCLYAIKASKKLGIPIVLHVHETLPAKPLYTLALKVAVRYAHAVVSVSKASQKLSNKVGAKVQHSKVVYNGVDQKFFSGITRRIPSEVAAAGPGPHIGVFAVLEPRKAQHVFLHAATVISPLIPSARFWIVGPAAVKHKQKYVEQLYKLADHIKLKGKVSFVGYKDDVASWLAAMDVVVQPSVTLEAFGMSLAESLALGTPVVASDVGGMPEVVQDGKSGFIVPAGNTTACALAIMKIAQSAILGKTMGQEGAADVKKRFSPEVFQQNIAAVYNDACKSIKS
jgi:glycosyltransferase involved in cell wall biosynthesis